MMLNASHSQRASIGIPNRLGLGLHTLTKEANVWNGKYSRDLALKYIYTNLYSRSTLAN